MVQYLDNNNSGFAAWNAKQNKTPKRGRLGGFLWWFFVFMVGVLVYWSVFYLCDIL